MDQGRHRGAHQHIRRHRQLLRGAQGWRHPVQAGQRPAARLHQEDQREQNGLQVHGEHLGLPRVRQELRCPHPGDLPERRPVGAPESELGGYLPAVAGSQGELITPA